MKSPKQSYLCSKVVKAKSRNGFGLFSIKAISCGEVLVDFSTGRGTYIDCDESDYLFKKGMDFMIQVDDNLFWAASNKAEIEDVDFINHSCNPNCGISGKLKIVAMRRIRPGEEITFDYAMSESSDYEMTCECNSVNCRKIIRGNDWKIDKIQKKYRSFFSDYLKRKILARHHIQ